jgi:hypothetical protein
MKKIYSFLALLFLISNSFYSQIESEVTGVWQWKKDGLNMKGSDFGTEQYKSFNVYTALSSDYSMYLVFAKTSAEISEKTMNTLMSKQFAAKGTYSIHENNIEGLIDGSPFSFIYDTEFKKMTTANTEVNIELIKVKAYGKPIVVQEVSNQSADSLADNVVEDENSEYAGVYYTGDSSKDKFYGEDYYGGEKRNIMVAPDGSRYYLGPSGRRVYVYKNGQVKIKNDAQKKADKQKSANQKAIQSQNRTKTKGSGKTGSYGNSSSSKKSGG